MRLSRFIFGFLQFAFWAAVAVVIALALLGCIVFLFESRKMQVSGVLRFAIIVTTLAAGGAAVLWWDERCRLRRLAQWKTSAPSIPNPLHLIPTPESIRKLELSANLALKACAQKMKARLHGFFLIPSHVAGNEIILAEPELITDFSQNNFHAHEPFIAVSVIETLDDIRRLELAVRSGVPAEMVLVSACSPPPRVKEILEQIVASLSIPPGNVFMESPPTKTENQQEGIGVVGPVIRVSETMAHRLVEMTQSVA